MRIVPEVPDMTYRQWLLFEKHSCGQKYQPYITKVRSFKTLRCLVYVWQPSIVNGVSEFVNMEKIGHRYLIQYFHLKDLSPANIKVKLDSTLGEFATKQLGKSYDLPRRTTQWSTKWGDHVRNGAENSQNDIGWSSTESAQANRHGRYCTKYCTLHIDWNFGH